MFSDFHSCNCSLLITFFEPFFIVIYEHAIFQHALRTTVKRQLKLTHTAHMYPTLYCQSVSRHPSLSFKVTIQLSQQLPKIFCFFRHIIKNKLQEMDTGSVPKLREAIKLMWCTGISQDTITHLVESMPRRMQAVIEAKGEMTKY